MVIGDRNAIARGELSAALFLLAWAAVVVYLARRDVEHARVERLEERRAMYAELEQREQRIDELGRRRPPRFVAPADGPAEEVESEGTT